MGVLDKIFKGGASSIIETAGKAIDGIVTNDEEKAQVKNSLAEIVTGKLSELASYQRDVIVQEMKGNSLQRNWRPLLMLTFGAILVAKWFGYTDASIPDALELELMAIIKYGLSGYVAGRSLEKISENITKNVDLPFIKKKKRTIE